jgi:hypothetical protein
VGGLTERLTCRENADQELNDALNISCQQLSTERVIPSNFDLKPSSGALPAPAVSVEHAAPWLTARVGSRTGDVRILDRPTADARISRAGHSAQRRAGFRGGPRQVRIDSGRDSRRNPGLNLRVAGTGFEPATSGL